MNSNRKKKKLIFVISGLFVAIFLIVFIFSYSFAGINSHRLNIPKSTCVNKELSLTEQDSSCEEKAFFENLAGNYSLEDIYEIWGAFNDEQQEVVLNYLLENDRVKYTELDNLIKNINAKKISNSVDGNKITVITEMPKNTTIEVEKTTKEKLDIIEDLDVGIVDSNNYVDSYTYDISMNNNKSNYVKNDALITISDIKADNKKRYFVYHLLDSVEAIAAYKDNDNLIVVDSNKFTGDFSEEMKAAKDYANVDNRIYVVIDEATVNNDGSISFSTNSFSTFHIVSYTVDFHYNDEVYSINGDSSILLSKVFEKLNIEKDVLKVVSVTFSNEELVSVTKVDRDWMLTSLSSFDTEEVLTIIFEDGEIFELKVTDDKTWTMFDSASDYFTGGEASYKIVGDSGAGKSEWKLHIMDSADGDRSPSSRGVVANFSDTANNLKVLGTQYKLISPNYWFYSSKSGGYGGIENGDNGVNDINMNNIATMDLFRLTIDVYAIPTLIYSSDEYGTVRQGSAHSMEYQYRTVKYYLNKIDNKHLITTWSGIMPNRGSNSSNNCQLSDGLSGKVNLLRGVYNDSYLPILGNGCNGPGNFDGINVTFNTEQAWKYYFALSDSSCRAVNFDNDYYEIIIYSRNYINFDANGGAGSMDKQGFVYDKADQLAANRFIRPGYTFNGWNINSDGTGDSFSDQTWVSLSNEVGGSEVTLYAMWLGDPKDYTVKHYRQKIDGGYELYETETISGKRVGDKTDAQAKAYDGFRALNFTQSQITISGALVEIYYDRNYYNYRIYHKDIDTGREIHSPTDFNSMFGATVNVRNSIRNDIVGYKFIDNSTYLPNSTINITSDSSNNVATIYYKYTEVPYKVNYYKKDLGSNTYTKIDEDTYTVNGKLNDDITYNTKTYTGFSNARVEYIDNNGNSYTGSKVNENLKEVNVYYDRNQYNVSYSYDGNVPIEAPSLPQNELVEYGATLTLPNVSVSGYEFSWNQTSPITVTDEISIVGTFTPKNDAFYRVRYYLKGTDTELKEMYECLNVIYNETYTVEAPEITGFTLDDSDTKTVVAGYAGSNNEISFVYKPSKVDYTVNYCLEDLDGQRCVTQTEILQGFSLDTISYNQSQIEGFTYNHGGNNSNGIIRPDGSTVVTLYYTRNRHSLISCITKDDDPSFYVCQNKTYKYGEEIEKLTKPTEDYYNFYGWIIDTPGLNTIPNTMPDHDINISGRFVRDSANLVIVSNWGDSIVTPIATFVVSDGVGNEVVVMTDNTGTAIVRGLSVGIEYTIVETSCDVGYICDDFIKHTMVDGDNTITFNNTVNSNNKNWLKSSGRNRNVFGEFD